MAAPVVDEVEPAVPADPPDGPPPPAAAGRLSLGRLVLEALAVAVVAVVAAYVVWGFRGPGLGAPLNYEFDGSFYLLQARLLEQGSTFTSPALGWPGGFQLYDLPQGGDALNLAVMRAVSLAVHDPATILNVFFLLTYGFVAGVGYAVLRHLRLGRPLAVVGALLYAFAPFHQVRNTGHTFLSNYALLPVAVLFALALLGDDPPLVRAGSGWRHRIAWRSSRTWWVVAGCVGLASTGAYYAVFAALLLLVAGTLAGLGQWRVRPLAAAVLMVGVLGATFLVNQSPSLWYWARNGANPDVAQRQAFETELYGLRINQLFLPIDNHRVPALARAAVVDNTTPLRATEPGQQLGVVAAAGLAGALAVAAATVLAGRRRARWLGSDLGEGVGRLGILAFGFLVVAAIGGISYLLSAAGLQDIRSWNRVSILLGFLGLLAVLWAAQRLVDGWSGWRRVRPGWLPGVAVAVPLLVVGFLDAVPARVFPIPAWTLRYDTHERFFQEVAGVLPPGAPVLQLPHIEFPEADDTNPVGPYDQARGYIFAPGLRWSFGWVTGRGVSPAAELAAQPPDQLVAGARQAGFAGIVLDRVGVPDPDAYQAALVAAAGSPAVITSEDGRYVFVPLAPAATTR